MSPVHDDDNNTVFGAASQVMSPVHDDDNNRLFLAPHLIRAWSMLIMTMIDYFWCPISGNVLFGAQSN